jgi:hypothetical protein
MWTDPITLTILAGSSIALALIAKRLTGRARAVAAAALVVVTIVTIWRTRSQQRRLDTLVGDRRWLCWTTRSRVDSIVFELSWPSATDADRARTWRQFDTRIDFFERDLHFCLQDVTVAEDCFYLLTSARDQADPAEAVRQVQIVEDALESVGHCGEVRRVPDPRPDAP